MNAKERARRRNWLKLRLLGSPLIENLQGNILTPEEQSIFKELKCGLRMILDNWDKSSEELGMKVRPKKDRFKT